MMNFKKILLFICILFIVSDLVYSFFQHAGKPLDGDLPGGILPAEDVRPVLNDPLGISAITEGKIYPNPNRFFSHSSFYVYFNTIPFALQSFTDPISSIYYSSAIFKTIVQLLLILLLASIINGYSHVCLSFVILTFVICHFFQTNGFQSEIGIIDSSITYTFFYAYPLIFLLLYFKPLFAFLIHDKEINNSVGGNLFRLILAFPVCLSGPLNPGIVVVICLLFFLNYFYDYLESKYHKRVGFIFPKKMIYYLLPVFLLALYSLYIGSFNSVTIANEKPLSELYSLLFQGIYNELTRNVGLIILLGAVFIQLIFLHLFELLRPDSKISKIYFWLFLFSIIYIFLLPFGGYREYRPEILRYDTLIPITLILIFLFVYSMLLIFKDGVAIRKPYSVFVGLILGIFIFKDAPGFEKNKEEKMALYQISNSDEHIVYLPKAIQVISWANLTGPEKSVIVGEMLYKFNITSERKVFYYSETEDLE